MATGPISSSTPNESTSRYGGDPRGGAQYRGAGAYNQARNKGDKKNQLMMLLLQMMMEDQQPEDKATKTYQEELAGDKESSLTPALANNPATALMGPQKPKAEPKDDFKNMLLALLLKSQG